MRCRIHTFQACSFDRSDTSPGWRLLASHGALAMPGRAAIRSSLIPAHALAATVAPFRAWRGSQPDVAGGPDWTAIDPAIRAAQSSGSRWARIGGGGLAIGGPQLCSALATPRGVGETAPANLRPNDWRDRINPRGRVAAPTRECAPARPQGHSAVPRGQQVLAPLRVEEAQTTVLQTKVEAQNLGEAALAAAAPLKRQLPVPAVRPQPAALELGSR